MKIVTSVASYAGQTAKHWKMLAALAPVRMVTVENESNVTLARCRQMTLLETVKEDWDVALLMDDDVFFRSVPHAEFLAQEARANGRATAALYPSIGGNVNVRMVRSGPIIRDVVRVLTGVGALAIPREVFEDLRERVPRCEVSSGLTVGEYCRSGASEIEPGQWWSEDFSLCWNLGGVEISSLAAMHQKGRMLELSPESFESVREQLRRMRRATLGEPDLETSQE
jgi:hypothetical protein